MGSFTSSELQGKNILLSYKPASSSNQAIYDSYHSVFDIPSYAVLMKPVIMMDGEVVLEGEAYLETTLGTKSLYGQTTGVSEGSLKE